MKGAGEVALGKGAATEAAAFTRQMLVEEVRFYDRCQLGSSRVVAVDDETLVTEVTGWLKNADC
jgi:hypothetical protein